MVSEPVSETYGKSQSACFADEVLI